jgi:hypothetical protein
MCTVSYIATVDGYILTSNRDEKKIRSIATPPRVNNEIVYPQDPDKGGTWITLRADGISLCLLNGGFIAHVPTGNYVQSRGQIVLQLAQQTNVVKACYQINLNGIEPFTLIIATMQYVYELVWTGEVKNITQLEATKNYIWSSSTLYPEPIRVLRNNWFAQWQQQLAHTPTAQDAIYFHKHAGDGDTINGLMMNREDKVFTVSITQIQVNSGTGDMQYFDLVNNKNYLQQAPLLIS